MIQSIYVHKLILAEVWHLLHYGLFLEAVIICILIIIQIVQRPSLHVGARRERDLARTIRISVLASIISMGFIITSENPSYFPAWLNILLADLYFCASPLVIVLFSIYLVHIVFEKSKGHAFVKAFKVYCAIAYMCMLALVIGNHFFPLLYRYTETQFIRYAPAQTLFYGAISLIVYSLISIFFQWKQNTRITRIVILITSTAAFLLLTLQFIWPAVRTQNLALMFAIIIFYLQFHSISPMYDTTMRCLNAMAFSICLKNRYMENPPRVLARLDLRNKDELRLELGEKTMDKLYIAIIQELKSAFGMHSIFRMEEHVFMIAVDEKHTMRELVQAYMKLNGDFRLEGYNTKLDCVVTSYLVPDAAALQNDIPAYLKFASDSVKYAEHNSIIVCDEATIAQYEKEKWIVTQLKEMIRIDSFTMLFSPIFRIQKNTLRIIGADCQAGLRIAEEIYPYSEVARIANRHQLLAQINEMVLQRACYFHNRLKERGFGHILLFCGVMHSQLSEPLNFSLINDVILRTNVDTTRIKLVLDQKNCAFSKRLREDIDKLQKSGIGVCMKSVHDANLNDLLTTPLVYVKFDETDLFSMGLSPRVVAFFKQVTQYFGQFGTGVIAENVSSIEHIEFLKSQGMEYVQGDSISPALFEREFIERLIEERNSI